MSTKRNRGRGPGAKKSGRPIEALEDPQERSYADDIGLVRATPPKRPPAPSGALPVPKDWVKTLAIRAPDMRALIATWTDPVTRKKGLSIYEEMLQDPQVASSLDLLKYAALSLPFTVAPPKHREGDKAAMEQAEAVQKMFDQWPGGLDEFRYQMLTCIEYGYSIIEPDIQTDKGNKQWVYSSWTTLPQALFGFDLDTATARIAAVRPWIGYATTKGETYPLQNFVVMQWNGRFNAPYGRSQLVRAYEAWWMKQLILRMRNTTLDRFGTPLIVARVPPNTPETKRKKLQAIIENLWAEAGAVIDSDILLDNVHEGAGQGASQGFQQAIEYQDSQIAKAITGVSLNANENRGTGTFAQARVHQDNFLYWVGRVAKALEEAIQNQIVQRFCAWNFGLNSEDCPRYSIREAVGEDLALNAQMWQYGQTLGVIAPHLEAAAIREALNLPPPSEAVVEELQSQQDMQSQIRIQQTQPPQTAQQPQDEQPPYEQSQNDASDSPDEEGWNNWMRGYIASLGEEA